MAVAVRSVAQWLEWYNQMALDPSVQLAVVSIFGTAITGAITVVGAIINAKMNAAADERKLVAQLRLMAEEKADAKLEHLTALSNSNLSTTTGRLDEAMARIDALTKQLSEQQEKAKNELIAAKDEATEKLVAEMKAPTTVPITQAAGEVAAALHTPIPAGEVT